MQLYYEALLELILKKEERRGGSYIHVCEEAELDQAGMSINRWQNLNETTPGENKWLLKERLLKLLLG